MAAHDKALIIDSLSNNWNATHAPAAGTTCTASVAAQGIKSRVTMTMLGYSVKNATLLTGPPSTLSVTHNSLNGTVVASWDIAPVNVGSVQDCWVVSLKGKRGAALCAGFSAPVSSIVQKVSIAGWHDSLSDG